MEALAILWGRMEQRKRSSNKKLTNICVRFCPSKQIHVYIQKAKNASEFIYITDNIFNHHPRKQTKKVRNNYCKHMNLISEVKGKHTTNFSMFPMKL